MPLLFRFAEARARAGRMLGVGPSLQGQLPLPVKYYPISGVTRDSAGAALGSCAVHLFRTADDVEMDMLTSDANGNFEFRAPAPAQNYYVVAYLPGSPDVAGTTVNTLTATA